MGIQFPISIVTDPRISEIYGLFSFTHILLENTYNENRQTLKSCKLYNPKPLRLTPDQFLC